MKERITIHVYVDEDDETYPNTIKVVTQIDGIVNKDGQAVVSLAVSHFASGVWSRLSEEHRAELLFQTVRWAAEAVTGNGIMLPPRPPCQPMGDE